jgi:hypothetical protein
VAPDGLTIALGIAGLGAVIAGADGLAGGTAGCLISSADADQARALNVRANKPIAVTRAGRIIS